MDFSKWNKAIDKEQYKKDLEDIEKNGGTGDYKEVPHGEYIVKVEKMELKESKKGDPMLSIIFRIVEGEFKKSCLFMNQVVFQPFQIHIANEFLKSMETDVEIEFDGNYEDYNNMILDVAEACDSLEFSIEYGEKKGFNTFKILEIYDA
jgi:hypothetical protein